MAEQYDGNGEYNYVDGSSDFKRKLPSSPKSDDDTEEGNPTTEKANEYIKELLGEKVLMDHKYPHAERLLEQEMTKVQQSGRVPHRDLKYVDIYREKQIRVTVKVLVPVKEHPKFNFVGKLLGPKGNSMKRLQEETMCKMAVLGRGSMKDRKKEDDLRAALDPKYAHLNDDLHVEISALAPPAEAHARVAYALAEVRKYLIPDSNDVIRQEQMREMIADGTLPAETADTENATGAGGPAPPYKPYKPRVATAHPPRASYPAYRAPAQGSQPRSPNSTTRTVMPAKQKILSILDRARNAMEESYGVYDEPAGYEQPAHYEGYSYSHPPPPSAPRTSRYEVPEYEPNEYGREYYREATTYPPVKSSSSPSTRSSWKTMSSNYASGSSSRHEESSKSSKHSQSNQSRDRYRSSPYSRPSK